MAAAKAQAGPGLLPSFLVLEWHSRALPIQHAGPLRLRICVRITNSPIRGEFRAGWLVLMAATNACGCGSSGLPFFTQVVPENATGYEAIPDLNDGRE